MEGAMATVTILIAVYNAEQFLHQCLDSLKEQTFGDFQAICVDDASTDGSLSILHSYAATDSRFEVISLEENVGQARARNIALERAKGEYTCFLDSDDWLSPDALQAAVDAFRANEELDCVLFDVLFTDEQGNAIRHYLMDTTFPMKGTDAFEASLTWKIHGVYMTRTSIHQRFPYDDSSRSYSDDNTTRLHYLSSRGVGCCDGVYHYRQHAGSTTHQVSVRRFDYLRANKSMKSQLVELGGDNRILDIYENVRWLNVIDLYMFYFNNRQALGCEDAATGLAEIKKAWADIEVERLTFRNRYKFGYCPIRFSWRLFRWQEELYFALRSIKNRF